MTANASNMSLSQCTIRVYYEDTDLGGVVYYANYLKFFERARTEWLRELGIENLRLLQDEKKAFVVTQCHIKYLQAAKMDDNLIATVDSCTAARASATLKQTIYRNGAAICIATVDIAFINLQTGRPARLPLEIAASKI
jgi:acyl-CoA thioester hydrolase